MVQLEETSDDFDPKRIKTLADSFAQGVNCDAIVLELPQLWIIPDPDFRAKTKSIGLYPGSFWMAFLKCWGTVVHAQLFFQTPKEAASGDSLLVLARKSGS